MYFYTEVYEEGNFKSDDDAIFSPTGNTNRKSLIVMIFSISTWTLISKVVIIVLLKNEREITLPCAEAAK